MKWRDYTNIEKENINALIFNYSKSGLTSELKPLLKQGERLGNAFKHKVVIAFKALEGRFKVNTTIWATTEKYVVLKGGVSIPIECIEDISL